MPEHSNVIAERRNRTDVFFETFILGGRYMIIPMYIGLTVGMCLYDFTFLQNLIELFKDPLHNTEETLLLGFLGLVDMSMIANLVYMITCGGYSIFIHEIKPKNGRLPRFLHHLTAGTLKIKMGGSLIGVSSIHLLKSFIDAQHILTIQAAIAVGLQIIIHLTFVLSALVMTKMEVMCHPPELEKD